ncbi:MAG: lysylphosphatidylglycerol synthase transmembrane domain-containing protein [Synechococcales bacterium]|nr:lysylphosphatidylglycerol synthase transmembrane domain-containing protein [Synechococcales bacterium]
MAKVASPPNLKQTWLRGALGMAVGAVFLWLALRQTTWQQVQAILADAHSGWLALAIALYGIDLSIRTRRWQQLLQAVKPLSFRATGMALLVGYAMNNLLPARLGELVRANFTGQRYQISRTAVIGSIAIERSLDGLIVVGCLILGRLFIARNAVLDRLTLAGVLLFVGIFVALWLTSRSSLPRLLNRIPRPIAARIQRFQEGLAGLQGSLLVRAIALSFLIWLFEGLALWAVLHSIDVGLGWQAMLVVIGVVSLSTLLPSPPGFVGTYQYAFAFIIGLLGHQPAQGIAAATATQIFLLGGVTAIGLALYLYTVFQGSGTRHER